MIKVCLIMVNNLNIFSIYESLLWNVIKLTKTKQQFRRKWASCSRLNPGARGEHLAIQLSWMAPWLLVKRVCPVHLVERWGCRSWTVVMAINKLFNYLLIRAGSMVDISPGSHRWNPGSIPQRRQKIILSYCHGNGLGKWWGRLWGSV